MDKSYRPVRILLSADMVRDMDEVLRSGLGGSSPVMKS